MALHSQGMTVVWKPGRILACHSDRCLLPCLQVGRAALVQSEACLKEKDALIEAACQNIQQMSVGENRFAVSTDSFYSFTLKRSHAPI